MLHRSCETLRRTIETSWRCTILMLLGVSFRTCLRCLEDVLMRLRCYVRLNGCHDVHFWHRRDAPLRRLGDVPSRHLWVFRLRHTCDVVGTQRKTSTRRCHDLSLAGGLFCLLYIILVYSLCSDNRYSLLCYPI